MISSLRWETWGSVYPWCPNLCLSRGVQISLPCKSVLVYCISSHLFTVWASHQFFFFLFLFLVVVFLTVVIEISLFQLAMFFPSNRQERQNWTTMALWCFPFSIQGHKSYFTVISWDVKCCHWKSFKMKIVILIFFSFLLKGLEGRRLLLGTQNLFPVYSKRLKRSWERWGSSSKLQGMRTYMTAPSIVQCFKGNKFIFVGQFRWEWGIIKSRPEWGI